MKNHHHSTSVFTLCTCWDFCTIVYSCREKKGTAPPTLIFTQSSDLLWIFCTIWKEFHSELLHVLTIRINSNCNTKIRFPVCFIESHQCHKFQISHPCNHFLQAHIRALREAGIIKAIEAGPREGMRRSFGNPANPADVENGGIGAAENMNLHTREGDDNEMAMIATA